MSERPMPDLAPPTGVIRIPSRTFSVHKLLRGPSARIGFAIVLLFALCAAFGPLLVPDSALDVDPMLRLLAPLSAEGSGLLGTDSLGRDMLALLVEGARTSFIVCFSVVGIAVVTGTIVGVIAGYRGGWVDTVISRYVEIQGAFPALLLCLLVLAVVTPSVTSVIVILAIERWPYYVKVTRSATLAVRNRTYVEGAGLIGASQWRVMFKHVLPGIVPTTLALAAMDLVHAILAESTLSFLGFGAQPPTVSWGLLINEGQDYIFDAWWLVVFPGVVLAVTVVGLNLMANSVQNLVSPQLSQKRFALKIVARGGTR